MMDSRGFLWVTQGEAPDQNGIRNDVWKSTVSLTSDQNIATLCQVRMPTCGAGLRCWPTDKRCMQNNRCPVESNDNGNGGGDDDGGNGGGGGGGYGGSTGVAGGSEGMSAGIIALIAIVIVAVAGGAFFLYYKYFIATPSTKDTLHTELIGQHGSTNGHTDTANGNYHPLDIGRGGSTTGAQL